MRPLRKTPRGISFIVIVAMLATHLPLAALAGGSGEPLNPTEGDVSPVGPENRTTPNRARAGWGVADPIVQRCPSDADRKAVGLCEAAVPSNCPGADKFSKERREGGLGKEILTWPPFSKEPNSEFGKKLTQFTEKKKDEYLNQLSSNHNSLNGKPADLKPSIRARAIFFQAEFGVDVLKDGTHYGFPVGLTVTCTYKRELGSYISAYYKAKAALGRNSATTSDACSGAFKEMYDAHTKAKQQYEKMVIMLDDEIDGTKIDHKRPDGRIGKFIGFKEMFKLQSRDNDKNLLDAQKTALSPELYTKLRDEYDHLWVYKADSNKSFATNGVYDQFLKQLIQERENAKKAAEFFSKNADQFAELKKRCESGTANPILTTASGPVPPSEEETRKKAEAERKKAEEERLAAEAERKKAEEEERRRKPDPADTTGGSVPPPPKAEQENGAGSFLKNNWMWLAGGAVLVAGGVYLYKRHKKKEKEKAYWGNDANFITSNSSSSSSTVSSNVINVAAGGQVPAGTRLIIVTPPSAPSTGATMGKIDVALVDANGVVQNINGLAIEASCLAPNPCSLTGGKSVTTTGGRASFDSLSFTQPDRQVVMQFSGPGLQSVTSQGTFDVGGSAPRQ